MTIHWKQTLAALFIGLLLGAAVGGLTVRCAFHGPRLDKMVTHLERRLDLTPEQKTQVQNIFEDQKPRMREIREQTRAEIAKILTPEQREKFEKRRPGRGLE